MRTAPRRRRAAPGSVPRLVPCVSLALLACLALAGCSRSTTAPPAPARSYVMGFSAIGPRPVFADFLAALQMSTAHADGAIMSNELPWDSLLAGVPPDSFVMRQQLPLAQFYRANGLHLTVMIDPANGLDRAGEAAPLVAAGRSMTEPAIQQLYRRYVVAMDTLLRPDELGLVLETNLIRLAAPAALYSAIRQAANDAAADVRRVDARVRLMASVQVETAWGRLQGGTTYLGIEQDFADFPFMQVLGLSSYPYLAGWARPEDLPDDYYARLRGGRSIPVLVTEGGWSSRTVSSVVTDPAMQRRYIVRHARLLDGVRAAGWYQLTFTDLDLAAWPASIAPFAFNGLVDSALAAKPALGAWDSVRALPRR